jgi:hypothetical protein
LKRSVARTSDWVADESTVQLDPMDVMDRRMEKRVMARESARRIALAPLVLFGNHSQQSRSYVIVPESVRAALPHI